MVRQHPAVLLGPVTTAVAGLAAAAYLSQLAAPGRQALDAAVWIAWGLLLLRAVQKVMGWSASYFVVTSERILMVTGVLTRRVGIIPLRLVNDLSLRRSPAGRLLGYGEFAVRYGARDQVLQRIQYLPYPEQLYLDIRRVLYGPAGAPPADAEPAGDGQET
jgi:membrane protein YdbS with pleckstrin-like domain